MRQASRSGLHRPHLPTNPKKKGGKGTRDRRAIKGAAISTAVGIIIDLAGIAVKSCLRLMKSMSVAADVAENAETGVWSAANATAQPRPGGAEMTARKMRKDEGGGGRRRWIGMQKEDMGMIAIVVIIARVDTGIGAAQTATSMMECGRSNIEAGEQTALLLLSSKRMSLLLSRLWRHGKAPMAPHLPLPVLLRVASV